MPCDNIKGLNFYTMPHFNALQSVIYTKTINVFNKKDTFDARDIKEYVTDQGHRLLSAEQITDIITTACTALEIDLYTLTEL